MRTTTEPIARTYPTISQSFIIGAILIGLMAVFTPLLGLLRGVVGKEPAALLYYLLTLGVAFAILQGIRRNATGENAFVLRLQNRRIIVPVVIMTWALIYGIVSPLQVLIPVPEYFKHLLGDHMSHGSVFGFAMMVIAAPILEELIFRGIMLDGLLKKYSPTRSILISSLIFGIVHLNPWQFVAGFILGTFSGWIYYRSQSLLPSIIIHMAANLTGFMAIYFSDGKVTFDATILTMYDGLINFIAVFTACAALTVGCMYFLQKEFQKMPSV